MSELPYGPVGDPRSEDIFEKAQAIAPEGWHIEGQLVRFAAGIRAQATTKDRQTVTAWGLSKEAAMANLLRGLWHGETPPNAPVPEEPDRKSVV